MLVPAYILHQFASPIVTEGPVNLEDPCSLPRSPLLPPFDF